MLSLIEVKCPHCGVQGQILLPPMGSIVVGPCPECQGMVLIFCGKTLALDSDIMHHGDADERRQHVMRALTEFVQERVDRLFEGGYGAGEKDDLTDEELSALAREERFEASQDDGIDPCGNYPSVPISPEEVASFRAVDLRLIDNGEYFRAIFR